MFEVADSETARTNVRQLTNADVDALKVVIDRTNVPEAVLSDDVLAAIIDEARAQTLALVDLPDGEGVVLELVHDEPWLAYNYYLGSLRGRVAVNVDLPMSAIELLHLAIHETYPGHQAERSVKEHLLVAGQGMLEESLVLVPTPQSLITEGIAELAPQVLLDGDGGAAFAAVLAESGIELDLAPHAMGLRCGRGVIVVEDGTVKSVDMEAAGKFEVSSADACLLSLNK